MITRLLFTLSLVAAALAGLSAQFTIQPLAGYEGLGTGPDLRATEKVDCTPIDPSGFTLLRPGVELKTAVMPDTFGLNGDITYVCQGCNVAMGGVALLLRDTLIYAANTDVDEVVDTLTIQGCGDDGECGEELTIVVVVQREGRAIDLPFQSTEPGGRLAIAGPDDAFAQKAFCRSIEACAPAYLGRDQRFGFTTAQAAGNDFFYEAARFGGTDAVCVTLCTAFGLCDTYRTEISVFRPSVSLPFLDDFSAGGLRPDVELWQDRDVLINRNFAQEPPTIGVATFDAVNSNGQAYVASGNATTEPRDYLTSASLKLAGETGTTLSFFAQPRGFGNRPERQDSFLVQFLHPDGDFRTIMGIGGRPTTEGSGRPLPFEPYLIVLDDEYLYDGFVFRFVNKSSERGAVDMWHLDYVKLAAENNDIETDDLALTQVPGSVLGPLSSIPLRHFQAAGDNLVAPDMGLGINNLSGQTLVLSSSKQSEINVLRADRSTIAIGDLTQASVFGAPMSFPPLSLTSTNLNLDWPGLGLVRQYLNDLPLSEDPIVLTTRYFLTPGGTSENRSPGFSKTTGGNNTASSTTVLGEYMAYDDGSAEATIELTEGTVTVQRYEAFVEDTLRGIQVRIPRGLFGFGGQDLRLVVYAGGDGPVNQLYEQDFDIVLPEDILSDTLEGFSTYVFAEPLALPAGPFFVGWEQLRSTTAVGIGYDRNTTPVSGSQFFDFGSGWRELAGSLSGTLMLRPLLDGFEGFTTSTEDVADVSPLVNVFPNPTDGTVQLRPATTGFSTQLEYRLFSAAGALLQQATGVRRLDLSAYPAGLYLLEVNDGKRRSHHKIVRN